MNYLELVLKQSRKFTIKKEDHDPIIIYTLSKDIFDTAVENTIKTFVGEENYQLYKDGEPVALSKEDYTITCTIPSIYQPYCLL